MSEIFQNPDLWNSNYKIFKHAVCLWQNINKLKLKRLVIIGNWLVWEQIRSTNNLGIQNFEAAFP